METAAVTLFDQIQVGDTAKRHVEISEALVDAFARVSGDYSPIHMNTAEAQASGFERRVVHGALLGSLISALVGMDLPGRHAVLQRMKLSFHKPVFPGDRVSISGEVLRKFDSVRTLQMAIHVANQDGAVVARGEVQVGLAGSDR
jgi:3-hydroxybutyryl-CoA dehydratase